MSIDLGLILGLIMWHGVFKAICTIYGNKNFIKTETGIVYTLTIQTVPANK